LFLVPQPFHEVVLNDTTQGWVRPWKKLMFNMWPFVVGDISKVVDENGFQKLEKLV